MANQKIIIAIDGFSSCGKSTLAKAMAKNLQYVFIDTGAMYRAVALFFLRAGIDFDNNTDIAAALNKITLQFKYNPASLQSDMYLNEENVEQEIREMRVSQKVSEVAAIALVRDFAVAQQQAMGESKGIVMDGRDIGTVVFPKAELKISAKNAAITVAEILENLQHRDLIDTTREHSPLKQADDALVLDNSNMTREAQLDIALQWAQERISQANNQ
jgi:cytidylate kinase